MTLVYNNASKTDSKNRDSQHLSALQQSSSDSEGPAHKKLAMSVHRHNELFYASLCRGHRIIEQTEGFTNAAEASLAGFRLFELFTKESGHSKPYPINQPPILWQ